MIIQEILPLRQQQLPGSISSELIVKFWSRSFTAIVTESGPKSRVHWIPSLETEKIMMILCKMAEKI